MALDYSIWLLDLTPHYSWLLILELLIVLCEVWLKLNRIENITNVTIVSSLFCCDTLQICIFIRQLIFKMFNKEIINFISTFSCLNICLYLRVILFYVHLIASIHRAIYNLLFTYRHFYYSLYFLSCFS